jgi:hypothetical protein
MVMPLTRIDLPTAVRQVSSGGKQGRPSAHPMRAPYTVIVLGISLSACTRARPDGAADPGAASAAPVASVQSGASAAPAASVQSGAASANGSAVASASSNPSPTPAGEGAAGLFPILLDALGKDAATSPPATLSFEKSTEADALKIVNTPFPLQAKSVTSQQSFEKRTRFVQANYEDLLIVYTFGNEQDRYRGKLIEAHFSLSVPDTRLEERDTRVFRMLTSTRGPHSRVEDFRFSSNSASDELDVYIWDGPQTVVTYRSYYHEGGKKTIIVTAFWEAPFYHSHHYWDY